MNMHTSLSVCACGVAGWRVECAQGWQVACVAGSCSSIVCVDVCVCLLLLLLLAVQFVYMLVVCFVCQGRFEQQLETAAFWSDNSVFQAFSLQFGGWLAHFFYQGCTGMRQHFVAVLLVVQTCWLLSAF